MFFVRIISRLPLSVLYVFSDFLFFVAFRVTGYRRKMVQKNLKNSFPEKSADELKEIERAFFKNLCDYAVETLKLLTISAEELKARMKFTNPEKTLQYLDNEQSIFGMASHQFNWEWLLTSASLHFGRQVDFVYQEVHSKKFDELSLESRTRFGAYPIKRDEVAREALRRKHITKLISVVGDQYPGYGRDKKFETKFLNQDTVFFFGLNHLAYLTQFPALYYELRKVKRGYYEATAILVAEPPYEKDGTIVIENYVKAVEKLIIEQPAGWLWSHNRWKTRHLKKA